jgi:hypothetical protein
MDERLRLSPQRFPFYQHSHASFFLAYESGTRPIGRLAVLDNQRYNEYNKTKTAFFYLFECENDPAAATALFNAGFEWARSRGLENIMGPKGFTPLDGFGLLVKGFEHRPAFGLPYNPLITLTLSKRRDLSKMANRFQDISGRTFNSRRASTNSQNASPNAADCVSRAAIRVMICVHLSHT